MSCEKNHNARGDFRAVLHRTQDEGSQGTFAERSMQSSFALQSALNTENNYVVTGGTFY